VFVAGQTTGDLLVRSGQEWGRLAGLTQGWVLTAQGTAQLPAYRAVPMPAQVWAGQNVVFYRDGVVVLATVPFNPLDYPGRRFSFQAVVSVALGDYYMQVKLYNVTDGEYVDDTTISRNTKNPTFVDTGVLAVDASPTAIKPGLRLYEVHALLYAPNPDPAETDPDAFGVVGFAGLRIVE
jgi:hypothetical protein